MSNEDKPKTKTKPKTKDKPKPKPKPKPKAKSKPTPKAKPKSKPKENKLIIEHMNEKEIDPIKYEDKLKHLLHKIKNQNNYDDTAGIRFAWK